MAWSINFELAIKWFQFLACKLGRRNRRPPQVFTKCPFFGSKVPFSCMKNVIKIAFFAQSALLKTWIYVISGKFFSFPGKISYFRKIFGISEYIFSYFGKNAVYPESFYGMYGKFFWDDSPRRQHFQEKFLGAIFFEKCPSKPAPPQLLEASYAPACK